MTAEVDLSNSHVTEAQIHQIIALISEHAGLLASEGDSLGLMSATEHTFRTEELAILQPLHWLPALLRSSIRNEVHQGAVQPSSIPWLSPVVIARKKDKS